jgi:hypothetical protein
MRAYFSGEIRSWSQRIPNRLRNNRLRSKLKLKLNRAQLSCLKKTKAQLSRENRVRARRTEGRRSSGKCFGEWTVRTQKVSEPSQLANTQGDKKMTQENKKEMPFDCRRIGEAEETANNVLNFTTTLRELRKNVDPNWSNSAKAGATATATRITLIMSNGTRSPTFWTKRAELVAHGQRHQTNRRYFHRHRRHHD